MRCTIVKYNFVADSQVPPSQADPILVLVRRAVAQHQLFAVSPNESQRVKHVFQKGEVAPASPLYKETSVPPLPGEQVDKEKTTGGLPIQADEQSNNQGGQSQKMAPRQPVVIGVSGGADSVCLAHILVHLADAWNLDLHIAYLNHNLRVEASSDAAFVAEIAQKLKLTFHVATLDENQLGDESLGVEGAARQVRYRFLMAIAKSITQDGQQPIVAVGHHADDQVETILLNLLRGGSLRGLSGMDWCTEWPDVRIVRPLLGLKRQEIMDFNRRHGLPWVEDCTNEDTALLRNRIRHEIIPTLKEINPNLAQTFGRTAATLRAEYERTTGWDRALFARIQPLDALEQSSPQRRVVIDLGQLLASEVASQRNIIRMALASLGNNYLRDIGFEMVEAIIQDIQADSTPGVAHPITANIVWTIGRLDMGERPLLSIHLEEALPFLPAHPLLNRSWQRRHDSVQIKQPEADQTVQVFCPYGWILNVSTLPKAHLPNNWQAIKSDWDAYLDAEIAQSLCLTTPIAGQTFMPLGMGSKHQSIGNLFTNRKILKAFRSRWPIIISRSPQASPADPKTNNVLWVCGLQLSETASISEKTETVLWLRWNRTTSVK